MADINDRARAWDAELAKLIPTPIRGDYRTEVAVPLSTTPTLISDWTVSSVAPSVNITEDGGRFTSLAKSGVTVALERSYSNSDTNPSDKVLATIDLQVNGTSIFTATAIVPPRVTPGGDGQISITDVFLVPAVAGAYYEAYVNGVDNGGEPDNARLIRAKMTVWSSYVT